MSDIEIGIEQARKQIGDLADRARYAGQTTYLTRHGKRIAAIVPLEDTMQPFTTVIEAQSDTDPSIWQPVEPAEVTREDADTDPTELAMHVAGNQTVCDDEGGSYRVRVWRGDVSDDNLPAREADGAYVHRA